MNVAVFPLDKTVALSVSLAACATAFLIGLLAPRITGWAALGVSGLLLLIVASVPLWGLTSREALVTPAKPVFSVDEARADPEAFLAWWKFFVEEVVRTNEVIHMPDPAGVLPHVLKPGARTPFYKGSIEINDLGYRGTDFPREKGKTYRILTLGESTTFGQTMFPDSVPWPLVLQKLIQDRLVCDRPVQVINGGVNAYNLTHGIERLRRDQEWLQADMVMTYFGYNTAAGSQLDVSRWFPAPAKPEQPLPASSSRTEVISWFIQRAGRRVYDNLTSLLGGLLLTLSPPDEVALLQQAAREPYYASYRELIGKTAHQRLVFLSFNTAADPTGPEEVLRFYGSVFPMARRSTFVLQLHNWLLSALAHEFAERVFLIDTSPGIQGRYADGIFLDLVHFTPKGDALMGLNVFEGLAPLLKRDKTLNCRPR